jgi:DNA-binding XRE family transcriptional regulator
MDLSFLHTLSGTYFHPLSQYLRILILNMEKEEKRLIQLGNRLRHFRKLNGYTNYEHLAYDLGISRSQYGKYENGGNIKFSTLCKILDFLGISFNDFFEDGFK